MVASNGGGRERHDPHTDAAGLGMAHTGHEGGICGSPVAHAPHSIDSPARAPQSRHSGASTAWVMALQILDGSMDMV